MRGLSRGSRESGRVPSEFRLSRARRWRGADLSHRNKALLSFGAEPEEPVDESLAKTKFKSAHDALDDERLSKKVLDDRGTSATLPPGMEGPAKRRREDSELKKDDGVSDLGRLVELARLTLSSCRNATRWLLLPLLSLPLQAWSVHEKPRRRRRVLRPSSISILVIPADSLPSHSDKVREEIAQVQRDLKKMSKSKDSDDEDASGKKSKKPKRSGPSLLQLERARYASAAGGKKKQKNDDSDVLGMLDGFRSKLFEAKSSAPVEKKEPTAAELALGIEQDGDSGVSGLAGLLFCCLAVLLSGCIAEVLLTLCLSLRPLAGRGMDGSLLDIQARRHSRSAYVLFFSHCSPSS